MECRKIILVLQFACKLCFVANIRTKINNLLHLMLHYYCCCFFVNCTDIAPLKKFDLL